MAKTVKKKKEENVMLDKDGKLKTTKILEEEVVASSKNVTNDLSYEVFVGNLVVTDVLDKPNGEKVICSSDYEESIYLDFEDACRVAEIAGGKVVRVLTETIHTVVKIAVNEEDERQWLEENHPDQLEGELDDEDFVEEEGWLEEEEDED